MNSPDPTDQKTADITPASPFYNSIVACTRALANDSLFTVSIGSQDLDDTCDVNLPLIADQQNQSLRTLIRGLGDSFAMMRAHHDPTLHRHLAPQDPVADRLFTLMERERFEAVGSRLYAGVAFNLQQVWMLAHNEDALSRFGGSEQLEFVLSCLCREVLYRQPLPAVAIRHLAPIRAPVEKRVAQEVQELVKLVDQQALYADCSLALIRRLGFDVSARTDLQEDQPEHTGQTEDAAERDQQPDTETIEGPETGSPDKSAEINPDTPVNDESVLSRNPLRDTEPEPEKLDPADSDPEKVVDPATQGAGESAPAARYRYAVFDRNGDETCPASSLASSTRLRELRAELDEHIKLHLPPTGNLVSRLEQVLRTKQRIAWQQDQDEGELDPRRLTRIITDPQARLVYRSRAETDVRDCAVTLLIDNSRSMFGQPAIAAAVCADVITRVLERCGVTSEVLGFTTVSMYGGKITQQWHAQGCPPDAGRLNNIRHIIYKSAEASWQRSRASFGLMLDKDILKQNIDGEALLWAYRRLQTRPESRRVLIVISDGRPSDSYTLKANHAAFLAEHLEQVVKQIERQSAVELVAIDIGREVSGFYRRSLHLSDLARLGSLILGELTRLLQR